MHDFLKEISKYSAASDFFFLNLLYGNHDVFVIRYLPVSGKLSWDSTIAV